MKRLSTALLAAVAFATAASAQTAPEWFVRGRALMDSNKADDAAKAFEHAVKLNDTSSTYHLWLANALGTVAQKSNFLKQGMIAPRIKREMERARDLDPKSIEAHDGLMQYYLQAPGIAGGSVTKARAEAAEIAKLDPLQGHFASVTIAQHEKDSVAMERELRAAIADRPDSVTAYVQLTFFLQRTNRVSEAWATIDQWVARRPDDATGMFYVGRLAGATGEQLDRGEKSLRAFLALKPDPADKIRPGLAIGHARLGDVLAKKSAYADARAEYELALKLTPTLDAAKTGLKQISGK